MLKALPNQGIHPTITLPRLRLRRVLAGDSQGVGRTTMDPTEALTRLLSASLARRRDRYVEFASRPKAHKKFLNEFYHQLADCFDPRHVVAELPANAWSMPAYSYGPPSTFGARWDSLQEAFGSISEAQLLVTEDGRYGVHTQEDCLGGPMFIKA